MIKAHFTIAIIFLCLILIVPSCGNSRAGAQNLPAAHGAEGGPSPDEGPNGNYTDEGEAGHAEIRSLLEKGLVIQNISYNARFTSHDNEFRYTYYQRDNLTKMVIQDGDTQSISVSDGLSTVYYSLPDKIGFTMLESGDDMSFVPSTEALLNEAVYRFRALGEESLFGYLCQVVETEDEFGVLKMWVSKTLGLPIKYIGTDDNGWYSLELTDIQLGEQPASVFAIPPDVVMDRW